MTNFLLLIEEKIEKQESDITQANQKLWDDYELTYISAAESKTEIENFAETQKIVNGIKNSIKALGNVNVGAIEEYAQTKERYDFLTAQRDDLLNAKETLQGVISDIEQLMTKQFKEQLEIINSEQRVAIELFLVYTYKHVSSGFVVIEENIESDLYLNARRIIYGVKLIYQHHNTLQDTRDKRGITRS